MFCVIVADVLMAAGSGGDHRTRLRQELLTRMFDDNVMELLLVIAQHAHAVCTLSLCPAFMPSLQAMPYSHALPWCPALMPNLNMAPSCPACLPCLFTLPYVLPLCTAFGACLTAVQSVSKLPSAMN